MAEQQKLYSLMNAEKPSWKNRGSAKKDINNSASKPILGKGGNFNVKLKILKRQVSFAAEKYSDRY